LISQQLSFEARLREAQVEGALSTGRAQTVTPATTPTTPVRPDPVSDGITALGAGLLLGVALAFLFEYLDDSIKTKEVLERVTGPEIPVLGLIPPIPQWDNRRRVEVASLLSSRSPAGEAYRSLRTSVQYKGLKEPLTSLLVTSPGLKEGKSTTVANLAVVLAHAGARVVMVDCDLRRPRLHNYFALPNEVGFTSVMIGDSSLSAALQPVSGVERLQLLSSGPVPANPSELLASERLSDVLGSLNADGTVVLIDSPPLLPVTDASVLAGSVDATLLVVSAGMSTKKQVQRAVELLHRVDAPVFGAVLNRVSGEDLPVYTPKVTAMEATGGIVEGGIPIGRAVGAGSIGIGKK